jgi:hypothetical protein
MKTPREILLEQHRAAVPKLDAIRRESVAPLTGHGGRFSLAPIGGEGRGEGADLRFLQLLWHELILPSRRIWAGLAAVWIAILAANFSMRDRTPTTMAKSVSPEMVQSFKQQEQLLTELIGPVDVSAAEPQKTYAPRPSSQRFPEILTA